MTNLFNRWHKVKFLPSLILGFIFSRLYHLKNRKNIVLIGGHAGILFDDNSKTMYQFLRTQPKYTVYWCYSNSREYPLSKIGNAVKLGSIKNYFLYYSAKFVIYSHSNSTDIAPVADRFSFRPPFRVHVSHGVEGLKKASNKVVGADLYTCTSLFEQNIKCLDWKVPIEKTAVTGIARFDNYDIGISKNKNISSILYLPTWRDWDYSLSNSEFKETDSYNNIVSLLQNEKLTRLLENKNLCIYIRLHPFASQFLKNFNAVSKSKNIKFIDTNISKLIVDMDAVITDYSSVAIDFFYLHKPVIFYQYDQDKFLKFRGAYLDYEDELFGELCKNEDELINVINLVQNQEFGNYPELRKKLFTFNDKKNSQRIITAIEDRLAHFTAI